MKRKKIITYITINGLIAALYVVLSLALGSLSFGTNGFLDIRISEILMLFAFISPFYFPGLTIGCLITNLIGSSLIFDFIIGTLQTVLACFILYYLRKWSQIAIILAAMSCGIIIGLELYFLGFSTIGLWILVSVFVSELITLEIGYFIYKLLMKNKYLQNLLN